jgi:hypothetical protein
MKFKIKEPAKWVSLVVVLIGLGLIFVYDWDDQNGGGREKVYYGIGLFLLGTAFLITLLVADTFKKQ